MAASKPYEPGLAAADEPLALELEDAEPCLADRGVDAGLGGGGVPAA